MLATGPLAAFYAGCRNLLHRFGGGEYYDSLTRWLFRVFLCDVIADLRGRKFGLLLSCAPDRPGFRHGIELAAAALARGADTYLYCLDDAVAGVGDGDLQELCSTGLKLYACAYGAQQRGLPIDARATYVGLTVLSDMFASVDRMVSFN